MTTYSLLDLLLTSLGHSSAIKNIITNGISSLLQLLQIDCLLLLIKNHLSATEEVSS